MAPLKQGKSPSYEMQKTLVSLAQRFKALLRSSDGVAAVEFAYLCPLLMLMTFGTFEMTRAIVTHKRFQKAAAMVGDLVAREQQLGTTPSTATAALDGIMVSAGQVMSPFTSSSLKVGISQLRASTTDATNTTVEWSYPYQGATVAACGTKKAMPSTNMMTAGNAAIVVEASYTYTPLLLNIIPGVTSIMNWTDTMAYVPRYGSVYYGQATQNTKCPPGSG
jgi:Flp pilus assembly protein TadG